MLGHCIYASAATCPFDSRALQVLLEKARANNRRLGITGMLLFVDGSFFQVLEGLPENIEAVLRTISADPRHTRISRIIDEPIAERSFAEWTMGYADVTRHDVHAIAGANDFFGKASCFENIDRGRATKLLTAFRDGRWRIRLASTKAVAAVSAAV
ncbi:MAG: BLUF domain-containing protein [Burkholderiaceae bacterium]